MLAPHTPHTTRATPGRPGAGQVTGPRPSAGPSAAPTAEHACAPARYNDASGRTAVTAAPPRAAALRAPRNRARPLRLQLFIQQTVCVCARARVSTYLLTYALVFADENWSSFAAHTQCGPLAKTSSCAPASASAATSTATGTALPTFGELNLGNIIIRVLLVILMREDIATGCK